MCCEVNTNLLGSDVLDGGYFASVFVVNELVEQVSGLKKADAAGSHAVFVAAGDAVKWSSGRIGNCSVRQRVRRSAPARIPDLVDDNPIGPHTSDLHFR